MTKCHHRIIRGKMEQQCYNQSNEFLYHLNLSECQWNVAAAAAVLFSLYGNSKKKCIFIRIYIRSFHEHRIRQFDEHTFFHLLLPSNCFIYIVELLSLKKFRINKQIKKATAVWQNFPTCVKFQTISHQKKKSPNMRKTTTSNKNERACSSKS